MARTKITAKKATGGPGPKRQLATMQASKGTGAPTRVQIRRTRSLLKQPLVPFTGVEYNEYNFLVFEQPEMKVYQVGDGSREIESYRVPVFEWIDGDTRRPCGFLPLPTQYLQYWVQLCYNVAHRQTLLNSYLNMAADADVQRPEILQKLIKQAGVELRNYLYCRKMIIEDIMNNAKHSGSLHVFDEYIIRERFDYHFMSDKELRNQKYWGADPFDPDMQNAMGKWNLT